MPSQQDVLDAGVPALPSPPAITNAALQYGNAYAATLGTAASPTQWGTYLRRVPEVLTGVAVVSNTCTVGPGAVLGVQATAAATPGPKTMIFSGGIGGSQVLVEPQADGTQMLTFRGSESVTECAVYLLPSSAELIAALDADATPEE